MKRLFIAINLPKNIKDRITQIISQIPSDNISENLRWLPAENWHLTISFLSYQLDEAIGPILESVKETANNFETPEIKFKKIVFGPPNRPPRMIWLVGAKETSQNLSKIKNYLEDSLVKNGVRFKKENREFNNAHITLARFKSILTTSDIINIDKRLIENLSFETKSLDLMESRLNRTGAEYTILQSMGFRNQ